MSPLEQAFTNERSLLWGLSFRMLGCRADADEVVQDAFVKALKHLPSTDRPLRPWLVRVTMNTARDRLRRRRRSPYVGPWLPSPVDGTYERSVEPSVAPEVPGERRQNISYALLIALEQLTPNQRAVWLLREIMGMTTEEAAEVLEVQGGTVKTTLHRARKAIGREAEMKCDALTGMAAVGELSEAIFSGDVERVIALLCHDVVALSDGGGVFHAALKPIIGPERVARFMVGLARKSAQAENAFEWRNECPAIVSKFDSVKDGFAPFVVTLFGIDEKKVRRIWSVSAPRKLAC